MNNSGSENGFETFFLKQHKCHLMLAIYLTKPESVEGCYCWVSIVHLLSRLKIEIKIRIYGKTAFQLKIIKDQNFQKFELVSGEEIVKVLIKNYVKCRMLMVLLLADST